jgi:hypothetical protein
VAASDGSFGPDGIGLWMSANRDAETLPGGIVRALGLLVGPVDKGGAMVTGFR